MKPTLEQYADIAGRDVIEHLRQLTRALKGVKVLHVNSTREGGGVAEILDRLVPLKNELGIDAKWAVITGTDEFFDCTKKIHNALQGQHVEINDNLIKVYEDINRKNAATLGDALDDADVVFIHDPQPAPLLRFAAKKTSKWVWRCHIDVSRPQRSIWKYLREFVEIYDASIWSMNLFAQPLRHTQYLIPPSIDPLSEKNIDLDESEIDATCRHSGIDRGRPLVVQISRFDRFKDPVGVIKAYRLAKNVVPNLQLVLAGGSATDDPEGAAVLSDVHNAADDDGDIHILELPPDSHRTINALQRAADVIMQKSTREGFGLTVTEALWKGKAVIGGDTGGIRLQVFDHHTGFRVSTPEGAALRLRYMLENRDKLREMGEKGRQYVRENFLLTRHLREYLTLMVAVLRGTEGRIELS
jgi:trehalose synthase